MTLREYIVDVQGVDIDSFLSRELSTLLFAESGRIIPENHYAAYLDYEISEIELHVELEKGSSGSVFTTSGYHIITLYSKEQA